ncbi:MAG: 5-bromo-4-chloroindolyl phosphate hydrolysis family protein [Atopobiaceae bacterium]|jgi:hypothetical protein
MPDTDRHARHRPDEPKDHLGHGGPHGPGRPDGHDDNFNIANDEFVEAVSDLMDTAVVAGRAAGGILSGVMQGISTASSAFADWAKQFDKTSPNERYLARTDITSRSWIKIIVVASAILPCLYICLFGLYATTRAASLLSSLAYLTLAGGSGFGADRAVRFIVSESRLVNAYSKIRKTLLKEPAITIKDLAMKHGIKQKKAVKYLAEYVKREWIPEGHLSSDGTTFFISDALWQEYELQLATKKQEPELSPQDKELMQEIDTNLAEAHECLTSMGDSVPSEVTSTIAQADRIGSMAHNHPEYLTKLGMFASYYLPTSVKLINAYAELLKLDELTPEEQDLKNQLATSLGKISDAFENICRGLTSSRTLDIKSDLDTIQTMLKQDGLSE